MTRKACTNYYDRDLAEAVSINDVVSARYYLNSGANPNKVVNYYFSSPFSHSHKMNFEKIALLSIAAMNGNGEMVELLINNDADINWAINTFNNPHNKSKCYWNTFNKVFHEKRQIIITFLFDYAVGADFQDRIFYPGLKVANVNFVGTSIAGKPITRKILKNFKVVGIENAIVTFSDIKKIDNKERRKNLVTRLLKIMAQRGQIIRQDIVHLPPLACAAAAGDIDIVRKQLEMGVDPNQCGQFKEPAIVSAARNRHHKIVKMLFDAVSPQYSPLCVDALGYAILLVSGSGDTKLTNYLLTKRNINQRYEHGFTLLHYMAAMGNFVFTKRLLEEYKADVNLRSNNGSTPLVVVTKQLKKVKKSDGPYLKIMKLLLQFKADTHTEMHDDTDTLANPLYYAVEARNYQAVHLLLPHIQQEVLWYHAIYTALPSFWVTEDEYSFFELRQILESFSKERAKFHTSDTNEQKVIEKLKAFLLPDQIIQRFINFLCTDPTLFLDEEKEEFFRKMENCFSIIELLLIMEAEPDTLHWFDGTPLQRIVEAASKEEFFTPHYIESKKMIALLIKHKADINAITCKEEKNEEGYTLLDRYIKKNHCNADFIKYLIQSGAKAPISEKQVKCFEPSRSRSGKTRVPTLQEMIFHKVRHRPIKMAVSIGNITPVHAEKFYHTCINQGIDSHNPCLDIIFSQHFPQKQQAVTAEEKETDCRTKPPELSPKEKVIKIIENLQGFKWDQPVVIWSWSRSFFSPKMKLSFRQYLIDMVERDFNKAKTIARALHEKNMDKAMAALGKHRNFFRLTTTTGMTIYQKMV